MDLASVGDGAQSPGQVPDKRARLIAAALREFATRGYANASTNSITEAAGVSKGILFHYFGSKAGLYLAAVSHSLEHGIEWGKRQRVVEPQSDDFIERLLENGMRKLRYSVEHPLETKLVMDAFTSPPDGLKGQIEAVGRRFWPTATSNWREGLDPKRFRQGVDVNKALEAVAIFLEGLRTRLGSSGAMDATQLARMTQQAREYLELIKYGIYERPSP